LGHETLRGCCIRPDFVSRLDRSIDVNDRHSRNWSIERDGADEVLPSLHSQVDRVSANFSVAIKVFSDEIFFDQAPHDARDSALVQSRHLGDSRTRDGLLFPDSVQDDSAIDVATYLGINAHHAIMSCLSRQRHGM
jgi:hypothetical protein